MESSLASFDKFLPRFTPNAVAAADTVKVFSGGLQLQTILLPLAAFHRAFTPGPMQPTAHVRVLQGRAGEMK